MTSDEEFIPLAKQKERAKADPEYAKKVVEKIVRTIRDNPELMAILERFKRFNEKAKLLGDGDQSTERLLIELHHETGIDVERLGDSMDIDQVEPWLDAALRRRTSCDETMTTTQACAALGDVHRSTLIRWANQAGIVRHRNQWRKHDIERLKRDHPT